MVNARKTVTSPKRSTNEAEPLVLVKVRLPQSLVSTLDAISKERGRASLIRDVIANRLAPHPALPAVQSLDRTIRAVQMLMKQEFGIARSYDDTKSTTELLENLTVEVQNLRREARALTAIMAQELINRAGAMDQNSDR